MKPAEPVTLALGIVPVARLAELWGMSVRQCADALRLHGVAVIRAPHTTVRLVRLADLDRLFGGAAPPDETMPAVAQRILSDAPPDVDAVLRSVGLRRRSA